MTEALVFFDLERPVGIKVAAQADGSELDDGLGHDPETAETTAESPASKKRATYPVPLCRYLAWHKSAPCRRCSSPAHARPGTLPSRAHEALRELEKLPIPQAPYASVEAQAALFAKRLGLGDNGTWRTSCRNIPAWRNVSLIRTFSV